MSLQIFLQGKLLGIEEFLLSASRELRPADPGAGLLAGRSRYTALLSEVLPRALLAELGLARILLGTGGGGQFLVVLPLEAKPQAESFLSAAASEIDSLSGGAMKLVWAITENLGDWSVVRRRLSEEIQRKRGTPLAGAGLSAFEPSGDVKAPEPRDDFPDSYWLDLLAADRAGWSPDRPGAVIPSGGKYVWPLTSSLSQEGIMMARHTALDDDRRSPASLATLAARAEGRRTWGVLRGDADDVGVRLRRAQTIEEHLQLSVLYKQFFAGELELLCSLPEFWQKVTILYSGGDDFAVLGAWDALIPLAREIQRLFHRFSEENLKGFPGPEGKTISMALALARDEEAALAQVFEEAGQKLELAKCADRDCIHVLGRTLEWRQLSAAAELRETMLRVAAEIGSPRTFLRELTAFYRRDGGGVSGPERSTPKPWKIYGRLNRALGATKEKVPQKLRTHLTNEMVAKGAVQVKLRPAGRVALEWTRLLAEV